MVCKDSQKKENGNMKEGYFSEKSLLLHHELAKTA